MRILWDDIRYFVALAENGSLTGASKALGVSHVTVMRRVRALEQAIGADLFVRRADGHQLTEAGLELMRGAREGGELIAAAVERAAFANAAHRRVRITTTEIVANWILLPHLATLASRPCLDLDASPGELNMLDGESTIAVRFRRPATGPFRIRKLATIEMALYSSANPVGSDQRCYIGWTGEFESIGLSRWLRRCFADAAPALALTTIEGHRAAAVAGLGVAALPRFVADDDPRLRPVATTQERFELTAWLALPEAIASRADVRDAVRLIRDAFTAARLR